MFQARPALLPAPGLLESAVLQRALVDPSRWKMVFKNQIWVKSVLIVTGVSLPPGLFIVKHRKLCVCVCERTHTHIQACIYVIQIYKCVCAHVYTYIYVYTHIYIHVYPKSHKIITNASNCSPTPQSYLLKAYEEIL